MKTFKHFLTEEVDQKIVKLAKEIADYTHHNNHTESIIELAKFLGDTRSVKVLTHIDQINTLLQELPRNLDYYRSDLRKELIAKFKSKYGQEAGDLVNRSF